jgi:hypothetical protein
MHVNPLPLMSPFWQFYLPALVSLLAGAGVLVAALVVYRRIRLSALKWAVALQGVILLSRAVELVMTKRSLDFQARWLATSAANHAGRGQYTPLADMQSIQRHQALWQSGISYVVTVLVIGLTITFLLVLMHEIQKLQATARPPATEPPVSNVA